MGIFLKIKFGCERKRGVKYPEKDSEKKQPWHFPSKSEQIPSTIFGRPFSINNKKSIRNIRNFFRIPTLSVGN